MWTCGDGFSYLVSLSSIFNFSQMPRAILVPTLILRGVVLLRQEKDVRKTNVIYSKRVRNAEQLLSLSENDQLGNFFMIQ